MIVSPVYKIVSAFCAVVATAGLTIASAPPAAASLRIVSVSGHDRPQSHASIMVARFIA